jgi:hypothetical protein
MASFTSLEDAPVALRRGDTGFILPPPGLPEGKLLKKNSPPWRAHFAL